jgi:hypothetical protein
MRSAIVVACMPPVRWRSRNGSGRAMNVVPGNDERQLCAPFARPSWAHIWRLAFPTTLQLDLNKQRAELALYTSDDEARHVSSDERENALRKMRGADAADTVTPVPGKRRVARISARSRTYGEKEPRRGP